MSKHPVIESVLLNAFLLAPVLFVIVALVGGIALLIAYPIPTIVVAFMVLVVVGLVAR